MILALLPLEDGYIVACDFSVEWTSVARLFWREGRIEDQIEMCLAPALETLDGLLIECLAGIFNFVFVDANKQECDDYFECLFKFLRPGGLAAIDNVLWIYKIADETVQDKSRLPLREFNCRRHQGPKINLGLIPIGNEVTLAQKLV